MLALGDPWAVRVVKNRYPLFGGEGLAGAHEVIIEHRAHHLDLIDYDPSHAALVLAAVQARVRTHEATSGIGSVLYFRNRGRRAGSSQPHPHGQITATTTVMPSAALRADLARDVRLFEVLLREATAPVASRGSFVAWCPPASERAFQVRIASSRAAPRFSALPESELEPLAALLVHTVRVATAASGSSDYNVILRDPPVGVGHASFFFDVLPRTGGDAGFELGSGISVCTVDPAEAADVLRTG